MLWIGLVEGGAYGVTTDALGCGAGLGGVLTVLLWLLQPQKVRNTIKANKKHRFMNNST